MNTQQYPTFDDWWNEIEHYSLRSERFAASITQFSEAGNLVNVRIWLEAAFEAGRANSQASSDAELQQTLLDAHALLPRTALNMPTIEQLDKQIISIRGPNPPPCYGEDDCSTEFLSRCPWRMTCGTSK
jgi:hypothetical protein